MTNTSCTFRLPSHSGWRFAVRALVVANHGSEGSPFDVTIVEVAETTERDPKHVVRFIPVADWLVMAERDGVYAADIEGRLIDRFVAATEPKARKSGKAAA
jgi:hypothetical protein